MKTLIKALRSDTNGTTNNNKGFMKYMLASFAFTLSLTPVGALAEVYAEYPNDALKSAHKSAEKDVVAFIRKTFFPDMTWERRKWKDTKEATFHFQMSVQERPMDNFFSSDDSARKEIVEIVELVLAEKQEREGGGYTIIASNEAVQKLRRYAHKYDRFLQEENATEEAFYEMKEAVKRDYLLADSNARRRFCKKLIPWVWAEGQHVFLERKEGVGCYALSEAVLGNSDQTELALALVLRKQAVTAWLSKWVADKIVTELENSSLFSLPPPIPPASNSVIGNPIF